MSESGSAQSASIGKRSQREWNPRRYGSPRDVHEHGQGGVIAAQSGDVNYALLAESIHNFRVNGIADALVQSNLGDEFIDRLLVRRHLDGALPLGDRFHRLGFNAR